MDTIWKHLRIAVPLLCVVLVVLTFDAKQTPTHPLETKLTTTHSAFAITPNGTPITPECGRTIPYTLNTANMPPDADTLVHDAIHQLAQLTGHTFNYQGATEKTPPKQSTVPHLHVTWELPTSNTFTQTSRLGTTHVEINAAAGTTGRALVHLNTKINNSEAQKAIIMHELSHTLGLGHSNTPTDLMYETVDTQTDLTDADKTALKTLENYC